MKKPTSTWVDYKDLKSKINVLDVIRHFGIELPKQTGGQFYGCCPLPGHAGDGDNPNAFSMNTEKNAWRCLTHCGSGNVIDLFLRLSGRDPLDKTAFRESALEMQKLFLGEDSAAPSAPLQRKTKPVQPPAPLEPNKPLDFTLQVKSDIPYLTEKKRFSPDFLQEMGIGWVSKGMLSGRVAVPIYNRDGQLVACAGRGLKEADIHKRGRWLFPKRFHKSLELFNQHRAAQRDIDQHGLVIVEGFWSTLRWHETGFMPVVGLMGSSLSEEQLERIAQLACNSRVWLMLDNDEAGQNATTKAIQQLAGRVFVRRIHYPNHLDHLQPEDFTPDELLELIPV